MVANPNPGKLKRALLETRNSFKDTIEKNRKNKVMSQVEIRGFRREYRKKRTWVFECHGAAKEPVPLEDWYFLGIKPPDAKFVNMRDTTDGRYHAGSRLRRIAQRVTGTVDSNLLQAD